MSHQNLMSQCPPGFQGFHQPRPQEREGGGVIIAVHESLQALRGRVDNQMWNSLLKVGSSKQLLVYQPFCYPASSLPEFW